MRETRLGPPPPGPTVGPFTRDGPCIHMRHNSCRPPRSGVFVAWPGRLEALSDFFLLMNEGVLGLRGG